VHHNTQAIGTPVTCTCGPEWKQAEPETVVLEPCSTSEAVMNWLAVQFPTDRRITFPTEKYDLTSRSWAYAQLQPGGYAEPVIRTALRTLGLHVCESVGIDQYRLMSCMVYPNTRQVPFPSNTCVHNMQKHWD
jgi:hypothetical protein